jgi:hypothetical protein
VWVEEIEMSYRIVECNPESSGASARQHLAEGGGREVASYDSAYAAMREMARSFEERGGDPLNWYLVDPVGDVLMEPIDLFEISL